jgi:hypothetical protein
MGYATDYQHDVFISYAHGPQLSKWSAALCAKLTDHLNDALDLKNKTSVNVWMDDELEGNVGLTEQLKARVESSAVILIVMSTPYLDSPWCAQEAEWFAKICQQRADGGERLFVVRYRETDEARWPEFLKDTRGSALRGYYFYASDRNAEADVFPFGYPIPEDADQDSRCKYYASVRNLAEQMSKRLKKVANVPAEAGIRAAPPATYGGGRIWNNLPPAPVPMPASDKPSVYLGVGTEDVAPEQQEVRAKLVEIGFQVLPPADDDTAAAAKRILSAPPATCTQAVFVLGNVPGRSTPIDGEDLIAWQVQEAKARGLKVSAWLPPSLSAAGLRDAKYRAFIEQLQLTAVADPAALVSSLGPLPKKAEEAGRLVFLDLPETRPAEPAPAPVGGASIDQKLRAILRELKVGVLPFNRLPQQGRDLAAVERVRQELRQMRSKCDGIMLLYQNPDYMPEDWLIEIYRDVIPRAKLGLRCAVMDAVGSGLAPTDEIMVFQSTSPSLSDEIRQWLTP